MPRIVKRSTTAPRIAKRKRRTTAVKQPARKQLPRFTDRIVVGNGLPVSPFCLGMVSDWRLIPAAFEAGVNYFFVTTDMHWPLYEQSRKGLEALFAKRKGIRDEIAVAGVCYPTQPEFCIAPFTELIMSLPGLERVDVLVAGGVYGPDLLARTAVLRAIAGPGKARAVGASFHDRASAIAAANHAIVDLCYIRYNPAHPGARRDLFPHLGKTHPPMFNFKSMRGFVPHAKLAELGVDPALWYPDATDYYRYALTRSDGLLFSIDQERHLAELDAAMQLGGLLPAEEDHLDELAVLTGQFDPRMK